VEVLSIYRRQAIIRDVCRRLNYQGRYVWLVPASDVVVLASVHSGGSRLRFRMLDISEEPTLKTRFIAREGHQIKLDSDTVVAAIPTLRMRRRDLLLFMYPARVRCQYWAANGWRPLSPEEKSVLRQQDHFDPATMSVAHAMLVYRHLVDLRGRPTRLGLQMLRK
jgi:hypothetical protein